MSDRTSLRPCPFCGGDDRLTAIDDEYFEANPVAVEIAERAGTYDAARTIFDEASTMVIELRAEVERLKGALRRIADWPYDLMDDCVAEARAEAAHADSEVTG